MWRRVRRPLTGGLERRLDRLEQAEPPMSPQETRALVEQVVHQAIELDRVVLERRVDQLDAALADVRAGLVANRHHTEEAVAAVHHASVVAAREHTEAAVEVSARKLTRRIETAGRAARHAAVPATVPATADAGSGAGDGAGDGGAGGGSTAAIIDPALYVALEDRFRGEPELISDRQRVYLPYLDDVVDADHPALDLGSGRGEWLALLADRGLPGRGVDSNPVSVQECRDAGLDVVQGDLVAHLAAQRPGSLGAVTLFQVVEHLPFAVLVATLEAAARALRPGGVLLAETPNALNLRVAASTFWIDPTHQRPLHPDVLSFLALEAGFDSAEQLFVNRIGEPEPDLSGLPAPAAGALRRLLHGVDGPGDMCLVARTSTGTGSD